METEIRNIEMKLEAWHRSATVGTPYSATTRNKAAKKRYQRVQYHTVLIFKIAIFVKVLRSRVMA